jgi:hypothetical protein
VRPIIRDADGRLQDDHHRGKALTYEFRTAEGRVCCKGNDVQLLCDSCKAKATTAQGATATDGIPPVIPAAQRCQ